MSATISDDKVVVINLSKYIIQCLVAQLLVILNESFVFFIIKQFLRKSLLFYSAHLYLVQQVIFLFLMDFI